MLANDPRIDQVVREVLSQPKFQAPGESIWDVWLARALAWLASVLGRAVDLVGGPVVAGLLALGLLAALTAVAVSRIARRRAATIEERISLDRILEEGLDPAELDRLAAEAAEREDWSAAVRARFVAGLARLDRRGVIRYRRGATTGQLARQVDTPVFDRLAADFDAIRYGGRDATADDLRRADEGWRELLSAEEARR